MAQDPGRTRLLAISPHLDDAVLSFGAGLVDAAQDGADVTVYTVFAGTPSPPYSAAAERMHAVWGFSPDDDALLYRRKEDIAALNHLGVAHRHGRFLDSIYRTLPDGRWLTDLAEGQQQLVINEQSPDGNGDLISAIKDDIKSLVDEYDPTLILTCAAIGNHIDHEIARDAALFAAAEKEIPIRLWADLPYAAFRSSTVELPKGFHLGFPDCSSVTADVRTRKFQAVEYYASQLLMLNGPVNNLFDRLEEHARKVSPPGGYSETTWSVAHHEDTED